MAFVNVPVSFSGVADSGALQIKSADVYLGKWNQATKEIEGLKYAGLSNQQAALALDEEKKEYKQDGVATKVVLVGKEGEAKFRFDEWSPEVLASAFGLESYMQDAANGIKRVVISAEMIDPAEWALVFKTELLDGTPLEFVLPRTNFSVDGDIVLGGGNEDPDFSGIEITAKALKVTIDGVDGEESALGWYDYRYTHVDVTALLGLPASLDIEVGDEVKLSAIVSPATASDQRIEWSSADDTEASVTQDGLVKGVKGSTGAVVITAKSISTPAVTATCAVTVTDG